MIVSVGQDEWTLYDEIRYDGAPESFTWLLPIKGEVRVGVSSDIVFSSLEFWTESIVGLPPRTCPVLPCQGNVPAGMDAFFHPRHVSSIEVASPYEIVEVRPSSPVGLHEWLAANGYTVGPDAAMLLDDYIAKGFGFLAAKLRPGATVKTMRPLRVTMKGSPPTVPLRMMALGSKPQASLSLWVVANARHEPKNYPVFTILPYEITWDRSRGVARGFSSEGSEGAHDYAAVYAARLAASGGRGWELETTVPLTQATLAQTIEKTMSYYPPSGPRDLEKDYLPVPAVDGGAAKSVRDVFKEDMSVLFNGIDTPRVSRFRTQWTASAMAQDLVVGVSADQDLIITQWKGPTVVGVANCATCPADAGAAAAAPTPSALEPDESSCSISQGRILTTLSVVPWLGLALLGLGRRHLRRR